jgi:hypothetical protein
VIPGDTDYRIFSQDHGNIPSLDIIFLLGGYYYHTSYDTLDKLLYALHFSIHTHTHTHTHFIGILLSLYSWVCPLIHLNALMPDLGAFKLVETICLAYSKPSQILPSYKALEKENLKPQPMATRMRGLFSLITYHGSLYAAKFMTSSLSDVSLFFLKF